MGKRFKIFDYEVDLADKSEIFQKVESLILNKESAQVVTLNPEMIMMGDKNPELKTSLQGADIALPDGAGLVAAIRFFGVEVSRIPGIEFSEGLIETAAKKGWKVGFLGAKPEIVEAAVSNLKEKYSGLDVTFVNDGYYPQEKEAEIVDAIRKAGVQILFVAMGVPKQEVWIRNYKKDFQSIMIGVGGSFDVWSGKINRAPLIFRKFGLEWLYRLLKEPNRFSRMFPTLPLFVLRVILNKKNIKKENQNV